MEDFLHSLTISQKRSSYLLPFCLRKSTRTLLCLCIILCLTLTGSLFCKLLLPLWFPPEFSLSVLLFLLATVPYSPLRVPSLTLPLPLPVSRQVVEIALKVSPILGAHMFQPLLPAVFRGIVDGEVSYTFISCTDLDWDYIKAPVKIFPVVHFFLIFRLLLTV